MVSKVHKKNTAELKKAIQKANMAKKKWVQSYRKDAKALGLTFAKLPTTWVQYKSRGKRVAYRTPKYVWGRRFA
jgi:hypothetical protein